MHRGFGSGDASFLGDCFGRDGRVDIAPGEGAAGVASMGKGLTQLLPASSHGGSTPGHS